MNPYEFKVSLTLAAREMLRPGEALVLDWHRLAVCCAGAGESSLYVMKKEGARKRKGLVRLKGRIPSTPLGLSSCTWPAARSG